MTRSRPRTALLAVAALLLGAPLLHAQIVVMDFESVPPFTDIDVYNEDGFSLTTNVGDVRINDAFSPGDNAAQPSFGFGQGGLDSSFILTEDAGQPFALLSWDLLEATSGTPEPWGVTVIGTKSDGVTQVTQTFTLDGVAGAETFVFSADFFDLIEVVVAEDPTNAFDTEIVQVDDIEIETSAQPLPLTASIDVVPNPIIIGEPLDVLVTLDNPGEAITVTVTLYLFDGGIMTPLFVRQNVPLASGFSLVDFPIFSTPMASDLSATVAYVLGVFDAATGELLVLDTEEATTALP